MSISMNLDEFYRDTYTPFSDVSVSDILSDSALAKVYHKGVVAYARGVSYQRCPELRFSLEEFVWQRGWDRDFYGNVSSISAFCGDKPVKEQN